MKEYFRKKKIVYLVYNSKQWPNNKRLNPFEVLL